MELGSSKRVDVLYLDEAVAVVHKPSGEPVHAGWTRGEPTTMARLRDHLGQYVFPVHRLDRATSGALVMARTKDAARRLSTGWPHVAKHYVALVRGTPPGELRLDHPVRRELKGAARVAAQTTFRFVARSLRDRCSLVWAEPHTGRLHQIRRHLKHLSHPIVGDTRYGHGSDNRHYREAWSLHRLALHAAGLRLPHPYRDETIEVWANLPDDLSGPLAALGLPHHLAQLR